jgi:hypothetical protein
MSRQQANPFWGRMTTTLAVEGVVNSSKTTTRSIPDMARLPKPHSLLLRRTNPVHCLFLILGERPSQVLNLDQLP